MDCIHLPKLGFDEFNVRIQKRRVPLSGGIELTHRCNLHCVHCYCRKDVGDRAAQAAEMSFAEICRIVDQIADEGCLYLFLTGGEPLLRPDFADIYDYIRNKGILLILFTNGTLITPQVADFLAQKPPLSVEISLYGASRETYESITGVPGSYERCRQAISLLLERGVRVALKTPLMTLNKHEIGSLQALASGLGVGFRYDPLITPRLESLDDRAGPYRYLLPASDIVSIEMADRARLEAWKQYRDRLGGASRPGTLFYCGAGLYSFFIDVSGGLVMCVDARWPRYDLQSGTLREGWNSFLAQVCNTSLSDDSPCKSCETYALCINCPGRSQLEYGQHSPDRRIAWLCDLGHLRAKAFEEDAGSRIELAIESSQC